MNIVIPDAPIHPDPDAPHRFTVTPRTIKAATAPGRVGYCVMCRTITTRWWDLTACDLDPVTDREGILTDQVALHESCIPALVDYWISMIDGPGGDDGRPGGDGDGGDDPGGDDLGGDDAADDPSTPSRPGRGDRLALLGGAYRADG